MITSNFDSGVVGKKGRVYIGSSSKRYIDGRFLFVVCIQLTAFSLGLWRDGQLGALWWQHHVGPAPGE
jgi:hypothetical protein